MWIQPIETILNIQIITSRTHPSHITLTSLRLTLPCGPIGLTWLPKDESLYIHAERTTTVEPMEVFGFGSGDFAKQTEAVDVMNDGDGRWLSFSLNENSLVILEAQRQLPEHIKSLPSMNTATWTFQSSPSQSYWCWEQPLSWESFCKATPLQGYLKWWFMKRLFPMG